MERKYKLKKNLIMTIILIVLTLTVIFAVFLPHVRATNVEITSVIPPTRHGKVGDLVRVVGSINTTGGAYQMWFGSVNVFNGTASQNKADANFSVPELPGGNYTLTLVDYETKVNATIWFFIDPAYYVTPKLPEKPLQRQEGDSVLLQVNVTGGELNTIYYANITVKLPDPLDTTYSTMIGLTNTTNIGSGSVAVIYPDAFLPADAHTNYTGLYRVYFNRTYAQAESEFFIGLTNASDYHRDELVGINAAGYKPNENTTITITYLGTNETMHLESVNATEQGIVNLSAPWPIPWNASIGEYNVTITGKNTTKPISDSQVFEVPGYPIEVYPRNLAVDAVPQILVEALDEPVNKTYYSLSDSGGLARLSLEKGNHSMKAFWKSEVEVGELNVTIVGNATYTLNCSLTNLKIIVEDEDENLIPFADLNISYQYATTKESRLENASETVETDLSGVFLLSSTLPQINYTINASRYGLVFNANNDTIENLPAEPWFNVTILCPSRTLTLSITEYHRNPLPNARIEMIEQMGGISYNEIANDTGIATIKGTFGKYYLRVYKDSILLNVAFIDLFNDTQQEIYCQLYNLSVSVKITDYFGQPIPSVNVILQREQLVPRSAQTQPNGIATFNEVIGGSTQITASLPGQTQPCATTTSYIDKPTTVEIKIDKYIMLAGFLIETGLFSTAAIVLLTVILVISIEVFRRRHLKHQKSEKLEPK